MVEEIYLVLGRNIRAHRTGREWTLEHVARSLGISYQQLQKYEKGANRLPAHMLAKLASMFECSIDELCGLVQPEISPEMAKAFSRVSKISPAGLRDKLVESIETVISIGEGKFR